MNHKLHDGPPAPFYVSKFNTKPISNKPAATLAALQWAADRAGLSYGRFIRGLMPADEARIQEEFDAYQTDRKRAQAERIAGREKRVDTPSTPDKECDV